jgi:ABC-type cobalamin transport system permease subunit
MLSFFLDQVCSVYWRMLTYADVCWRHHTHSLCILSFFLHQVEFLKSLGVGEADDEHKQVGVCWRMLTYADVCWRMLTRRRRSGWRAQTGRRMLTYADVCWRMLTYAD